MTTMNDLNGFTRRSFLQTSLALVSTAATVPLFLQRSALAVDAVSSGPDLKSRPGVPDERILVVVQLTGGNDGLNTVIPYGDKVYYNSRPVIGIKEDQVIKVDPTKGIGLNPEMVDFKAMLDGGLAAIVQGVGYPNPNRSHFTSMDIWQTADPAGGRGLGWVGKALDQSRLDHQGHLDPTACVCIGREAPLAANGHSAKPISFESANLFRWIGADLHPALGSEYDQFNRAGVAPGVKSDDAGGQAAFIMRTALDAQIATDRIRAAVAKPPVTAFPGGPLANQLRMVSSMIRAGLPTRVYYVSLGGFDTHANQLNGQARVLREFASGVRAFYNELGAMGQRGRVLTMAFSEFGRRVGQNASNGTDHGTAAPVYLFGDMIQPGLIGEHPSLTKLDNGDLIYNTDFRSVYAAILDGWLKIDSKAVLGAAFNPVSVLNAAKV